MKTTIIQEPSRDIPVLGEYDVVACGGGPAGCAAAIGAARHGEAYQARHARLRAGDAFDIRYGCLVAAGIDNLLMAGRCLSAEHVAESSLRIQQTCMATGEAAGVAAALSLDANTTPCELDPVTLVAQLERDRDVAPAVDLAIPAGRVPSSFPAQAVK